MHTPLSIKVALICYEIIWLLAIPFMRMSKRLQPGFNQRTLHDKALPKASVWMQAASAGEAYLAWEILKNIKNNAALHILVTTNTKQGFDIMTQACAELQANMKLYIHLRYCPFDRPSLMENAVKQIGPKILVLLETELWPGLLTACRKNNVLVAIINGRITPKSLKGYSRWKTLWQHLRPDMILAVSDNDAQRFKALFPETLIKRMPNIKFDRMKQNIELQTKGRNPIAHLMPAESQFVVFGSIRKEEESLVINVIKVLTEQHPQLIISVFPRHLHRIDHWQKIVTDAHLRWSLRSQIKNKIKKGSLLLWDTFGELNAAYGLAQSAFVGGSLVPLGGHNLLEPLTCGVVPISGPDWSDFSWLGKEIIDSGLLKIVDDWQALHVEISKQLTTPFNRDDVRQKAMQYIQKNLGGAEMAATTIIMLLEE